MPSTAPLDAILHQPVRTRIVAYLAGRGEATFSDLKRVLGLTDGNLDAHLRKLLDAGYVTQRIDESSARSATHYALTPLGRQALRAYFEELRALLEFAAPERPAPRARRRTRLARS